MKIILREDSVEIDGYVNAVERNSKPLWSRIGRFVERMLKGAFQRALGRAENVFLFLNHDKSRALAQTADGSLELHEDSIGLHARAIVTASDVIEMARGGELVGWSFGFMDVAGGVENSVDQDTGLPLRKVRDLDLREVSILNRQKTPAYDGTLVSVRSDEEAEYQGEAFIDEPEEEVREQTEEKPEEEPEEKPEEVREEAAEEPERSEPEQEHDPAVIDYSHWENIISSMKGEVK